jgi:hypothetical protein
MHPNDNEISLFEEEQQSKQRWQERRIVTEELKTE